MMETPVVALCVIVPVFVQAHYRKVDTQKLPNLLDLPDHLFHLMASIQMQYIPNHWPVCVASLSMTLMIVYCRQWCTCLWFCCIHGRQHNGNLMSIITSKGYFPCCVIIYITSRQQLAEMCGNRRNSEAFSELIWQQHFSCHDKWQLMACSSSLHVVDVFHLLCLFPVTV